MSSLNSYEAINLDNESGNQSNNEGGNLIGVDASPSPSPLLNENNLLKPINSTSHHSTSFKQNSLATCESESNSNSNNNTHQDNNERHLNNHKQEHQVDDKQIIVDSIKKNSNNNNHASNINNISNNNFNTTNNSNNPFITNDEQTDFFDDNTQSFMHRPASFVAATERYKPIQPVSHQNSNIIEHEIVAPFDNRADLILVDRTKNIVPQHLNQNVDAEAFSYQHIYGLPLRPPDKTINENNEQHDVQENLPNISSQTPHWTEAVYQLNNALLEKNSVAGGSENGQFIHIVENGNIILELDNVKVSGYTIEDFVKILEAKPAHLLKAVQTENSHGLTIDLKQYLNLSFPNDCADKNLQNTIRENLYKRTIPCTTRPPKHGEVDQVDYNFLTREQFIEMHEKGMILECGTYGEHFYGTMRPYCDLNYYQQAPKSISNDNNNIKILDDGIYQAMKPASHLNQSELQIPQQNHETQSQPTRMPLPLREEPIYDYQDQIPNNWIPENPKKSEILAVDSESLPIGWERVIDQNHGTYYIDHNTQRTQFERPFEVELIKNEMGLGFTLLETDCGYLIVRTVIINGPAFFNGNVQPGDILVSAMGVSLIGLQDTDVAGFFSTFELGAHIKLVFARGGIVLDSNIEPDEYLISNGTDGNLQYALNPNSIYATLPQPFPQPIYETNPVVEEPIYSHNPQLVAPIQSIYNVFQPQQNELEDYEYHEFVVERGESGFGFNIIGGAEAERPITIGSIVLSGAASRKGQLKSGDEILSINGIDVVGATHEFVVELMSSCADKATILLRRKKFGDAFDVVLCRASDEGFGFVIISRGNCALIGSIIEGSPAHRCKQLHVRDRIISVNGRYITPDMQHPEIVSMIKSCGETLKLRIIPVDCYSVELIRNEKGFGFSIRGGAEHDMPLYVLRFASDGRARGLLNVGDEIIEINEIGTAGMTHEQAVSLIKRSDPIVKLKLRRNHATPSSLLVDSPRGSNGSIKENSDNRVTAEITAVSRTPTTPAAQSESSLSSSNVSGSYQGSGAIIVGNGINQHQIMNQEFLQQHQLQQQQQQQQQQHQHQHQQHQHPHQQQHLLQHHPGLMQPTGYVASSAEVGLPTMNDSIYGNSSQQQVLYAN